MGLHLSGDASADKLLSEDGYALLVGMVLDQQIPLERAFSAPAELKRRLGGKLTAKGVAALDPDKLAAAFSEKPALHRFPGSMAERVQRVSQIIVDDYAGDAAKVWKSAKTGDELFANLCALPGFGKQKAQIFAALLAKQLKVRPAGWEKVAGPYGQPKTFMSIADIDSPAALERVRAYKREVKAKAKLAGAAPATPASKAKR